MIQNKEKLKKLKKLCFDYINECPDDIEKDEKLAEAQNIITEIFVILVKMPELRD